MGNKKTAAAAGSREAKAAREKKQTYILIGIFALIALFLLGLAVYGGRKPATTTYTAEAEDKDANAPVVKPVIARPVTIKTTRGDIELEIYPTLASKTVSHFTKLVESKYYEGLKFDRVDDNLIQGGAPGNNSAGGVELTAPLETSPDLKHVRGVIAMAKSSDPNSSGPQFYIVKKDSPSLDNQNAVFGKVDKGMELVDQLTKNDKILGITVGAKK